MSHVKSRREMYADATRAAVLDVATRLFAERGYAGTALADVAADAQVTRGAVYHHFSGKQALFEAVLGAQELELIERIAAETAEVADPWDAALAGLESFLDRCCDPTYGRLVWKEGPSALGLTRWKECEKEYAYGLVEQFVHSLTGAGYLRPSDINTTVWFCFQLLGAAGLRLAETGEEDKRRMRDECSAVIRAMLLGLRGDATGRGGG
ncbi:TetR/AcrR family transcriptional regulator [Haloechinothrix alba]|nr:TetR/AcrR family transcriptional regulator [Haloechinothrix alba]